MSLGRSVLISDIYIDWGTSLTSLANVFGRVSRSGAVWWYNIQSLHIVFVELALLFL